MVADLNTTHAANRSSLRRKLDQTINQRADLAKEMRKLRAERERQSKIKKGIIKESDPLPPTHRTIKPEPDVPNIYDDPESFPLGRPHSCLYLTMYPGKGDVKPGQIG